MIVKTLVLRLRFQLPLDLTKYAGGLQVNVLAGLTEIVTRILEKDWVAQQRSAPVTQPPAVSRPILLASMRLQLCPTMD